MKWFDCSNSVATISESFDDHATDKKILPIGQLSSSSFERAAKVDWLRFYDQVPSLIANSFLLFNSLI